MAFTVSYTESEGGGFKPVPEGTHIAVCNGVVDLGTHYSEQYKKWARKCVVMFQIQDDGVELSISKQFSVSLHEKAGLRIFLEQFRGKKFSPKDLAAFDLQKIIGDGCQLLVTHAKVGEKTYANIQTVMPLPKGVKAPDVKGDLVMFSFEDDQVRIAKAGLPQWLQTRIEASKEWKELTEGGDDDPEDDGGSTTDDEEIAF